MANKLTPKQIGLGWVYEKTHTRLVNIGDAELHRIAGRQLNPKELDAAREQAQVEIARYHDRCREYLNKQNVLLFVEEQAKKS